jgi:uncharacterized membrane protein
MKHNGKRHAMNKLLRILRHWWLDESDVRRALDAAALGRIEQRVAASEQLHSGEIRVCVEAGLPLGFLWRGAAVRERAMALFGELRVWDTEHNNGVLVYLMFAERRIEIVADRGIARRVAQETWQAISDGLAQALQSGHHERGLLGAVDQIHALLKDHFALTPGTNNPNELSNRPEVR